MLITPRSPFRFASETPEVGLWDVPETHALSKVVVWFFATMSLMESKGAPCVANSLSMKYAPTLMRGWCMPSGSL